MPAPRERGRSAPPDPERAGGSSAREVPCYLPTSFQHYLVNQRELARASSGERAHLSRDAAEGETRYGREPIERETPERAFERAWVRELLARAFEGLRRLTRRIEALGDSVILQPLPQAS